MSVLVTGGAGYIGSHTCVELLNAGYDIVVLDNFSNSKPEVLDNIRKITNKNFKFYKADLLDYETTEKVFKENEIDEVIHFAGSKAVGESTEKPVDYYHNNITGTIKLLQLMKKYNCFRLVFSSSATVYGIPKEPAISEDFDLKPENPYGRTKLYIEMMLKDLCASDKRYAVSLLRYFNPIGAHSSALLGDDPNGIPNNLMPYISRVAANVLDILPVYGNDYATHDGTGIRDYIHVVDLSIGHLAALKQLRTTVGVQIYNLGTGTGYSVLDVVNAFEKANNIKISYKFMPRRGGDIDEYFSNPKKANTELLWKAEKSITDMCADSWNFTKNRYK